MTEKVAIIIPAYNEELTIRKVIDEFHAVMPQADIIVVNNCSTDNTEDLARASGVAAVINEQRKGKAEAVRRAFSEIEADIYVMVDADCTYSASDLPEMLKPVLEHGADMVVGNRHAGGAYAKENKRRFHNGGNFLVIKLINLLFRGNLQDILSGYRVMTHRFVKHYPILSRGFAIETEMSIHALDKGYRIVEIPIRYKDRPEGSFSKLNTVRDGVLILRLIMDIFVYYRPLAFFSFVALLLLLLGLGSGAVPVWEFYQTAYITHLPLAVLAVGLVVCGILSFFSGIILDGMARSQRFSYELQLLRDGEKVR